MDCNPPSFSVHGIFQARMLEWIAISFSRGSSQPRNQTQVSSVAKCVQLFVTLDCSSPGSSVHGIIQASILEWVAIFSSRGSSHPGIEQVSLASPALAGGFFSTGATWEGLL